MPKKVTVTIDKLGNAVVETSGFTGKECTAITRQLEQALGKVTSDKKKPEYHRQARQQLRGQA